MNVCKAAALQSMLFKSFIQLFNRPNEYTSLKKHSFIRRKLSLEEGGGVHV